MGDGDLPEECRFLLNTQLMFLKKEKDPRSNIRSLTEAQEITADVPEESVLYDQQAVASSNLPWIGVHGPSEVQRLQAEHAVRLQENANVQLGGPEKLTGANDPRHVLQKNGGLADMWYMDDGDILYHPVLVPSYLQEFDVANAKVGAERNPLREQPGYSASRVEDQR